MNTKKQLTRTLQELALFTNPKLKDEQYATPADITADVLWKAFMLGDIEDKEILDLGCGTGILGIGALLLGAKSCIFLEKDESVLNLCRKNLDTHTIPVCIMNPPFGTKVKHADKLFLEKAMKSMVIYSFHKTNTLDFVRAFVRDHKRTITHQWNYQYPLKKTMLQHRKKVEYIAVSVVRIM